MYMKLGTVRFIDYWLGIPLCFLIWLWHKTIGQCLFRPSLKSPKKMLFIELSEMGSTILAYPALVRAQREFNGAEIYFLIFKKNVASVELLNLFPKTNILTIEEESLSKFVRSFILAIIHIRRLKIDTVIDMELFSRFTAICSYVFGSVNRVGFFQYTGEGLYRGNLLTHKVLYNSHQHMTLNYLALVYSLKSYASESPYLKESLSNKLLPLPHFELDGVDNIRAFSLLRNEAPDQRFNSDYKLIVLNPDPGALLPLRGWPVEYYCELVNLIINNNDDVYIVLTGLKQSLDINKKISDAVSGKRCIDLSGKTSSLVELVEVIALAHILITNDGGPAHFAALTNAHVIVLFGPETPNLYKPHTESCTTLYSNLSCSPCLSAFNHRKSFCENNRCLQLISVDQVYSAVENALV